MIISENIKFFNIPFFLKRTNELFPVMYCTQDCTCSLCRELRSLQPKLNRSDTKNYFQMAANDNFILRRRLSDIESVKKNASQSGINKSGAQKPSIIKSKSYNELCKRFEPRVSSSEKYEQEAIIKKTDQHKVIIYFGDSISSSKKHALSHQPQVLSHANRLCEEMEHCGAKDNISKPPHQERSDAKDSSLPSNSTAKELNKKVDVVKQLKCVFDEKKSSINTKCNYEDKKVAPIIVESNTFEICDKSVETKESLPSFIESIVNGVINIKIEDNFECASNLVKTMAECNDTLHLTEYSGGIRTDDSFDWSFVQDWRTRYAVCTIRLTIYKLLFTTDCIHTYI